VGGNITDTRGAHLLDFIAQLNLEVVNESDSSPTFATVNGQSWIDVTLTRDLDITNWKVEEEEESLSDHRYVTFEIVRGNFSPKIDQGVRFNTRKADWSKFKITLTESVRVLENAAADSVMKVEELAEAFQKACITACRASMPLKKPGGSRVPKGNTWWNEDLKKQPTYGKRGRNTKNNENPINASSCWKNLRQRGENTRTKY
jgi:retrotransposon-encoded endonuclease